MRGIALAEGDEVISMSLVDAGKGVATEERDAYLRQSRAQRQAENADEEAACEEEAAATGEEAAAADTTLSPERFDELKAKEEFVLTVASTGFGKRTSAYEYRVTGRGGKGVELMRMPDGGQVVAAFPVRRERPDHAGHRRRHADPLSGRRNPHRGPRRRVACASSMSARASALFRRSASARMTRTATAMVTPMATAMVRPMARTIPKQTVDKDRPCR